MSTADNATASGAEVMMVPWLHFAGGDNLFFKSWQPSSGGAIAGASIALVFLAILERWVAGMLGNLNGYWRHKSLAIIANRLNEPTVSEARSLTKNDKEGDDIVEVDTNSLSSKPVTQDFIARRPRVIPPFILSHDVPRGMVFALQALLAYVLMLAVMTFQAAYIISIVVGLGIGEMLFGRMGGSHIH
ncbi:hypothetical protein EIP91_005022 [Steccherinum ochraceum]|uniref:Copper transport protein n=1 Tax=Steccherinum ochraceum TaxID=92696 RepID=A0A4R0RN26_9APHY|nr:hypothetical protein EIP91_005022 [Steccherinum ochraceum]